MTRPTGGDWGIIGAGLAAGAFNIVAAGRRREMICGAFRRHAHEHPAITAALTTGLVAHLYGKLDPRIDPLHWLGVITERIAEVVRKSTPH